MNVNLLDIFRKAKPNTIIRLKPITYDFSNTDGVKLPNGLTIERQWGCYQMPL